MKNLVLTVFFAALAAGISGYSAGTTSVFDIGIGVRAQSMGNAGRALLDDSSAVFFNQSALQTVKHAEVQAAYIPLYFETVYNYFAAALPTMEYGTFALSAANFSTSGITLRDNKGFKTGEVSQGITEIIAGWGMDFLLENLCIGAAAKVDHYTLGDSTDTSFGADFSMLYIPVSEKNSVLSAGLSVKNLIEPEIKLGSAQDNVPRLIYAGASYMIKPADAVALTAALDAAVPYNTDFMYFAGAEAKFFNILSVRGGYNSYEIFSAGAGAEVASLVCVDYAMFAAPLDTSHRFSFRLKLGEDAAESRKNKAANELKRIERKAREMAINELQELRKGLDKVKNEATKREYFKALHYTRGLESYYGGDLKNSAIEFDTVYKEDPDYMNTRYYYSLVKNVARRDKAEDYPKEVLDLYRAGVEKYLNEDYAGAREEWQKILKIDPYNKLAIDNLKEVNSLLRDIEKMGEQ